MQCNPAIENDERIGHGTQSCLTPRVLYQIRDEYNKDHASDPIRVGSSSSSSKDLNALWYELRERLSSERKCSKEDCWLKEIDNQKLRKQIDDHLFAPDHPPEWNKNPTEWLSNFDIEAVIEDYVEKYADEPDRKFKYLATSAINYGEKPAGKHGKCVEESLCHFHLKTDVEKHHYQYFGAIFNLDRHDQPGSHWVSFLISVPSHTIYYFDSAASAGKVKNTDKNFDQIKLMPKEVKELVHEVKRQGATLQPPVNFTFKMNPKAHQKSTTECGMYSLYFLIHMLNNERSTWRRIEHDNIPDKVLMACRKTFFNTADASSSSKGGLSTSDEIPNVQDVPLSATGTGGKNRPERRPRSHRQNITQRQRSMVHCLEKTLRLVNTRRGKKTK